MFQEMDIQLNFLSELRTISRLVNRTLDLDEIRRELDEIVDPAL